MNELWKDIKGYENLYQVSNMFRVRRVKRNNILATINKKGRYPQVELWIGGQRKRPYIHILVANAFPRMRYTLEMKNFLKSHKS